MVNDRLDFTKERIMDPLEKPNTDFSVTLKGPASIDFFVGFNFLQHYLKNY
jgi:hypothetical protein